MQEQTPTTFRHLKTDLWLIQASGKSPAASESVSDQCYSHLFTFVLYAIRHSRFKPKEGVQQEDQERALKHPVWKRFCDLQVNLSFATACYYCNMAKAEMAGHAYDATIGMPREYNRSFMQRPDLNAESVVEDIMQHAGTIAKQHRAQKSIRPIFLGIDGCRPL